MNPSGQPESFHNTSYQRPNMRWECGRQRDGDPCPIGPNGAGQCQVHQLCYPQKKGDAWICGRDTAWGGQCENGPVVDPLNPETQAVCSCAAPPCAPRRSLRSKRQWLSGLAAAVSLGVCLILVGGSSPRSRSLVDTTDLVSPGPLTTQHSTIQEGCIACHTAAGQSPSELLISAVGVHTGIEDSAKCLVCHEDDLGNHAMHPHGLPAVELAAAATASGNSDHTLIQTLARSLPGHRDSMTGDVSCAACHHEHRGREFNLTQLSNEQCQTCHSSTFHSLQEGHPQFDLPKTRHRSHLYFDHKTHAQLHFRQSDDSAADGCRACHVPDQQGKSMQLLGFDRSCASCHLKQIVETAPPDLRLPGWTVLSLQLPEEFDVDAVEGEWPERTTPKRRLPSLMKLLLASDAMFTAAWRDLTDSSVPDKAVPSRIIARSIKSLVHDLVTRRQSAVRERLQAADTAPEILQLTATRTLTQSGFFEALAHAQLRWFPNLHAEFASDNSAPSDAEGEDPESAGTVQLKSLANVMKSPWESTDGLSIEYRCQQHADPLIGAWLDMIARDIRRSNFQPDDDPLASVDLAQPDAAGRCVKCHTADFDAAGVLEFNWKARQTSPAGFTFFSHKPHVTLLNEDTQKSNSSMGLDQRCEHCHVPDSENIELHRTEFFRNGSPHIDDHHRFVNGLAPVRRNQCIACHTPQAAENNCLKCHTYHVGSPQGAP